MRINNEAWELYKEKNKDSYGGACVAVAENVMNYLDSFQGDFNIGYHPDMTTPHGIICHCDTEGGITGFMAGAVRSMVTRCHSLGWKFYLADVINSYNIYDENQIFKYVDNVSNAGFVTKNEAQEFVDALKNRFKEKNKG